MFLIFTSPCAWLIYSCVPFRYLSFLLSLNLDRLTPFNRFFVLNVDSSPFDAWINDWRIIDHFLIYTLKEWNLRTLFFRSIYSILFDFVSVEKKNINREGKKNSARLNNKNSAITIIEINVQDTWLSVSMIIFEYHFDINVVIVTRRPKIK